MLVFLPMSLCTGWYNSDAKLFLPTDVKNSLTINDKLVVYLIPLSIDTAGGNKQLIITAKKCRQYIRNQVAQPFFLAYRF